ncbi:hypothetical protein OXX79_013454, partial [Metschnikowia pulcherrima]
DHMEQSASAKEAQENSRDRAILDSFDGLVKSWR